MNLLCFPYAGASSSIFLKWRKYFDSVKIIPIDPPGRGKRMIEPPCKTMEDMIIDIKKQLLMLVDLNEEYSVYGHSMGCLLIFELLHELQKANLPMPVHVFLSGKNPPDIAVETSIHQLNDTEFIEKVLNMGGMEASFFENPSLTKLFLPILRADLCVVETYCYTEKKQPLHVDISVFFSPNDMWTDIRYINRWSDFTSGSFSLYNFTGDHFFIFKNEDKITGIIEETLSDIHNNIPY